MAITMTNGLKNVILESGIDTVFNAGILEIRTGAAPGAAALATGTLLCAITLPADAFAGAASGAKAKAGTWSGTGAAAGNAGYFRMRQSADAGLIDGTDERLEGTVTATGGGGDLTLDNINIALNQAVTVNTFSVSL